jgi:hypothetical protein
VVWCVLCGALMQDSIIEGSDTCEKQPALHKPVCIQRLQQVLRPPARALAKQSLRVVSRAQVGRVTEDGGGPGTRAMAQEMRLP